MRMTDIVTRLRSVRERRPATEALAATLFAGGIVIAALMFGRETETAPRPNPIYQPCGAAPDDAGRTRGSPATQDDRAGSSNDSIR
jgi:hypothetical protein